MMISLNIVWPAMYVAEELFRFWFLVFATIVIETFTIKFMLKYSFKKSFLASAIGNLISGFAGVILMMIGMFFWHLILDMALNLFFNHKMFDNVNWIATYVIMCLGSIFIEVLTIHLIFKEKIKRLFLPLLIGNLLTYSFIAYSMTNDKKALSGKRIDTVYYYPIESHFILLDSTKFYIHKAKTKISYNEDNKILNVNYPLMLFFEKDKGENIELEFRLIKEKSTLIKRETTKISLSPDTLRIILKQRNLRQKSLENNFIVTDTLYFVGPDRLDDNKINYPDWK